MNIIQITTTDDTVYPKILITFQHLLLHNTIHKPIGKSDITITLLTKEPLNPFMDTIKKILPDNTKIELLLTEGSSIQVSKILPNWSQDIHTKLFTQYQQNQAEENDKKAERIEAKRQKALVLFNKMFGIYPNDITVDDKEHVYITHGSLSLKFFNQFGDNFQVLLTCPKCGEHAYSQPCDSLKKLADIFFQTPPSFRSHTCPSYKVTAQEPTPEERLVEALVEIIDDRLSEM